MKADKQDSTWTDEAVADLRRDFGEFFAGRTCLVTGADGFMGSHLTEALVALGANVACLRARHLERRAEQHRRTCASSCSVNFADLTDKTSVDYLVQASCWTRPTSRTSSTSARRRTSASRGTGRTRR